MVQERTKTYSFLEDLPIESPYFFSRENYTETIPALWTSKSVMAGLVLIMTMRALTSATEVPDSHLADDVRYFQEFPWMQFFGKQIDYRPDFSSCLTCSVNKVYACGGCCSCDSDCMKYQHCCIDYIWSMYASYTSHPSPEGFESFIVSISSGYKETRCMNVSSLYKGSEEILMVAACPHKIPQDNTDKQYCENETLLGLQSIAPVLGDDGYIYKNLHCARCHAIATFTLLDIRMSCKEFKSDLLDPDNPADVMKALSGCTMHLETSAKKVCNTFDKYDRPTKSLLAMHNNHSRLCMAYGGSIKADGVSYKNQDCAMNISEFQPNCDFGDSLIQGKKPLRFSMLIEFADDARITVEDGWGSSYSAKKRCVSSEIFNVFLGECVPFKCGGGYERSGKQCVLVRSNMAAYSMTEQLKECIAIQSGGLFISMQKPQRASIETLLKLLNLTSIKYIWPSKNLTALVDGNLELVLLGELETISSINATILLIQSNPAIFASVLDIYLSTVNQLLSLSNFQKSELVLATVFPDFRLCAKPRMVNLEHVNISSTCALITPQSIYNSSEYVAWIHMNASHSQEIAVYVCDGFYKQTCSGERRLETNYTVWSNLSIETSDQSVYQFFEYSPTRDGVEVCRDRKPVSRIDTWKNHIQGVEAYASMIGMVLSMMADLWVIVTFLYFHELRTNPGKNVVSLCLSLLCTDIILLSQLEVAGNSNACKAMAILLHFFLLSTHSWAAVITFDIAQTFLLQAVKKNHRSKKAQRLSHLAGWGSPFLLVLLGVILDETAAVEVGYGRLLAVCWIRNAHGRLAFFIVPSLMVILACFFTLVIILYNLRKQKMQDATILCVRNSDRLNIAKMAFKLVILLGLVEIVGFAQGSENASRPSQITFAVLQVLFSVLRSLRGVFIWVFYILLNRKVWSLYRGTHMHKRFTVADTDIKLPSTENDSTTL